MPSFNTKKYARSELTNAKLCNNGGKGGEFNQDFKMYA